MIGFNCHAAAAAPRTASLRLGLETVTLCVPSVSRPRSGPSVLLRTPTRFFLSRCGLGARPGRLLRRLRRQTEVHLAFLVCWHPLCRYLRCAPILALLNTYHPCQGQQERQVREASSSRTPYPSPRRRRQGSLILSLLLSPANPRCWALPGARCRLRRQALAPIKEAHGISRRLLDGLN